MAAHNASKSMPSIAEDGAVQAWHGSRIKPGQCEEDAPFVRRLEDRRTVGQLNEKGGEF